MERLGGAVYQRAVLFPVICASAHIAADGVTTQVLRDVDPFAMRDRRFTTLGWIRGRGRSFVIHHEQQGAYSVIGTGPFQLLEIFQRRVLEKID